MKQLPNILTILRILLVPIFIFEYLGNHQQIALFIFAVAGLTDLADGYIARTYHFITPLGTMLDPLADKLMLLSVLYCLAVSGVLPVWIAILMTIKEMFLVVSGIIVYFRHERHVIPSNIFGKAATVSFSTFIILLLIFPYQSGFLYGIYLSLILKLVALISYVILYLKHRRIMAP